MLSRRTPEIVPLMTVFDRFFSEPFFAEGPAMARLEEGTLALDISETDAHVVVRASVPGFRKEDVDVEVHNGVLSIKASAEEKHEDQTERYFRKERRVTSMSRRVALPSPVQETGGEAELKDGVLTLRIPKVAKEQPKKIRIN